MPKTIQSAVSEFRAKTLDGGFEGAPYPHKMIDPALDWEVYERLERTFPDPEIVYGDKKVVNNLAYLIGAADTLKHPDIDPEWKEFFENVASADFFRAVLEAVAPYTRKMCPDFEERLGKKMEEGTIAMRDSGEEADFYFDVQIGVNSPVKYRSRVRAIHVDRTVKVLNSLLYMRHPDDDVPGGDLEMYDWKGERKFERVTVPEKYAKRISSHKYGLNRMLMFANSPDSLHGASPRKETNIVRRYINFLLESRIPIFDLTEYQVRKSVAGRIKKFFRPNAA